jgi:ribonuclease D
MTRCTYDNVMNHYCGVRKGQHQRDDWRQRPLTDSMKRYAQKDSHYLLCIYSRMTLDVAARGSLGELFSLCDKLALRMYEKRLFWAGSIVMSFQKAFGDRVLTLAQRAVWCALFALRDKRARQEDLAVQCVCPDKLLAGLAERCPTTPAEVRLAVTSALRQADPRNFRPDEWFLHNATSIASLIQDVLRQFNQGGDRGN